MKPVSIADISYTWVIQGWNLHNAALYKMKMGRGNVPIPPPKVEKFYPA